MAIYTFDDVGDFMRHNVRQQKSAKPISTVNCILYGGHKTR